MVSAFQLLPQNMVLVKRAAVEKNLLRFVVALAFLYRISIQICLQRRHVVRFKRPCAVRGWQKEADETYQRSGFFLGSPMPRGYFARVFARFVNTRI